MFRTVPVMFVSYVVLLPKAKRKITELENDALFLTQIALSLSLSAGVNVWLNMYISMKRKIKLQVNVIISFCTILI